MSIPHILYSFIEIQFMDHKIYPFNVYNSVIILANE